MKTSPRWTSTSRWASTERAAARMQARIDVAIDRRDHGRDGGVARVDPVEDRRLPRQPVTAEFGDAGMGVLDGWAVAGQEPLFGPCRQPVERCHVVGHVAVGRRDDAGRPAHHVVAGEGQAGVGEGEGEVVGGVAGRGDRLDPPAVAGDAVAVAKDGVRPVAGVVGVVEDVRLAGHEGAGEPMRPARERPARRSLP